jgi:hypothetical protein
MSISEEKLAAMYANVEAKLRELRRDADDESLHDTVNFNKIISTILIPGKHLVQTSTLASKEESSASCGAAKGAGHPEAESVRDEDGTSSAPKDPKARNTNRN